MTRKHVESTYVGSRNGKFNTQEKVSLMEQMYSIVRKSMTCAHNENLENSLSHEHSTLQNTHERSHKVCGKNLSILKESCVTTVCNPRVSN
jgi:hypothetical protein